MSLTAVASGFVVFLLSIQVIQGQYGWGVTYTSTQICALKGSTVEISCTYTYPSRRNGRDTTVEETFWFAKFQDKEPVDLRRDSRYAGRFQYSCSKNFCTLRITDLRESDSAEYKFRFITNQPAGSFIGLPVVTLSVTDLQVQVIRFTIHRISTEAELLCHSSCRLPDHPSYIWYKNGQNIQEETSSSYSGHFSSKDSYSCAVKGLEGFPSPSVCVRYQYCNRVNYPDRSICAFKGSSVDISCTYNSFYTIKSIFWFSPKCSLQWQNPSEPEDLSEDSQYAGRVQVLETARGSSTLRITDLRESDSAEYHFKFKTGKFEWRSSLPGTTLTVTDLDLQVQVIRSTVHNNYPEAELLCHSSCRLPDRSSFVWFKNGQKMERVETSSYKDQFYPGDIISCAVKGHEDFPSPSVYAPKLPSVSVSPSAEIVEGSSVTLTCSSDAKPAAKYTWYKENQTLLSKEPQLVFSSIQSSDSGEYYCAAENELGRGTSKYIIIMKYAPKLPSVSVSPSAEIVENSSVTLTCSSDANPAANYTWYKENQTLLSKEPQLVFSSIQSSDSGEYYCAAENELGRRTSKYIINVKYAPKLPSVSVSPSAEIVEGSSVTLTCSSDANPAANYTWYKENKDSPKASGQNFTITDFRAEHSGNYYCEAQNRRGRHNSTLHLIIVAEKSTMIINIIRLTLVVVMTIPLLLVCLWMRKKKTLSSTAEPNEPIETVELESDPVYTNISALKRNRTVSDFLLMPSNQRGLTQMETEKSTTLKWRSGACGE